MMDRLLQFYQEQIHFLIQKESVAYGICIDLTDNTMLAKVDQNLNLIFSYQKIFCKIFIAIMKK